jgi:hypothetical protein
VFVLYDSYFRLKYVRTERGEEEAVIKKNDAANMLKHFYGRSLSNETRFFMYNTDKV